MDDFGVALGDMAQAWPALVPPSRIRVSEGIARVMKISRPGGGSGYWNPVETPYMVEPVDMLASRMHSAVVFVGPAQTGKTVALVDGWMAHSVVNDPGDMAIFQMTQDKAREFSKQRVDRMIRNSPELRRMRSASSRDDNLHDKQFRNGMWVRIAWPTATNMSSTSYRSVAGTDYDRWPDDIDGEGDGFTLMGKRTTTFLSRGMVCVESSPGRPVTKPDFVPTTPHEAPPVTGILGIYNRSDRRQFYWACVHCGEWLRVVPGLSMFRLPSDDELLENVRYMDIDAFARQHARIACPHCGGILTPAHRESMNRAVLDGRGGWLADGLQADAAGRISGTPRTSSIAGFWLGGIAATYVSWETLIRKQLQALLEYALTSSELQLQTTANTDQGIPYMSRYLAEAGRGAGAEREDETKLQRYVVPEGGLFLVAACDIQGGKNARVVVQVHAVGMYGEQWLVDRYAITESNRDGVDDRKAPLDPAAYPEDWDLITEKVVKATYRTQNPGLEMRIALTVVDSGGEGKRKGELPESKGGVTHNAYAWYRRLRQQGLHRDVRLIKGVGTRPDWHVRKTEVGGKQGAGDVPLWLLEPNKFKDMVAAGLRRQMPGPGYYHFPKVRGPQNPDGWLSPAFNDELGAEVRNEEGLWEQIRKRNESFDLCYMIRAGIMMLGCDKKGFWESLPAWAAPLERNSYVVSPEVRRAAKAEPVTPSPPSRSLRRSRGSGYLS